MLPFPDNKQMVSVVTSADLFNFTYSEFCPTGKTHLITGFRIWSSALLLYAIFCNQTCYELAQKETLQVEAQ